MEYIIGGILAVIVIITIGLLLRKKLYDSVDYYEDWKLDVMNRNVASELSKMKELNLEGDARERFEEWKEAWEHVLTIDLANVEESLYDTEKAADRYNFPVAKKCMKEMETVLVEVEKKIEKIVTGLDHLLETEVKNREAVETLEPRLKELKTHLSKNRFQYSRAETRFEEELNEIHTALNEYHTFIEEGNYLQGTELVEEAASRLDTIAEALEEFPALYKKCKQELPMQLDKMKQGLMEMRAQGYAIDDLELDEEIESYQSRLLDMVKELEEDSAETVKAVIPEMEERITEVYDILEQEAIARNFVETKVPRYERALDALETVFMQTQSEVEELKQAYYFEDTDLEQYMALEQTISQLKNQLNGFQQKVSANSYTHSKLRAELEHAFDQLETVEQDHETFKDAIHNLRKDELEARERIQQMNEEIYKINRKIRNSNLPGVPDNIWSTIEEASAKNERVLQALEEQPLDIIAIQRSLDEANEAVENAIENTQIMLEQAQMTEQVIQYANRYRSSEPSLRAKLIQSEKLFRKAEYELSLEEAAKALEEIEPGALKKVEKYQERTVS